MKITLHRLVFLLIGLEFVSVSPFLVPQHSTTTPFVRQFESKTSILQNPSIQKNINERKICTATNFANNSNDHHQQQESSSSVVQQDDNDDGYSKIEKAWRHVKKPLLRVGGKGVTLKHANSLRELLAAHTVTKVKFNCGKLGTTLEEVAMLLKDTADDASLGNDKIELIRMNGSDGNGIVLFGRSGAMEMISNGSFPPPPPPEPLTNKKP